MMLGYLLARAGVDVVVLEKHADFLRDFRGDTIHPSTLEIMHELGLLDEFLKRPHQEMRELPARSADDRVVLADFSHLPTHCRFIAFMPQWDFLDFLADAGEGAIRTSACACRPRSPIWCRTATPWSACGRTTPEGTLDVRADLVVGADGRHSAVRDLAGSRGRGSRRAHGRAVDARLQATRATDPRPRTHRNAGHLFVMLDRGDYWQCAFIIPKGGLDASFAAGASRPSGGNREARSLSRQPRAGAQIDWDDIKLLTVAVDRLRAGTSRACSASATRRTPCLRSAASASISPFRTLSPPPTSLAVPLRKGPVPVELLAKVQGRREWPTRMMQTVQIFVQKRIISNVLAMQARAARALRREAAQPIPVAPPTAGAAHRHGLPPRARAKP